MSNLRRRQSRAFYAFAGLWILGTVLLTLFPLAFALGLSFTDWDGITPGFSWVGFENYLAVAASPDTWASLGRTGMLAMITVPLGLAGGLGLAVLLNQEVVGRPALRSLIYLPALIPPVAATLVWKLIFERDAGPANGIRAIFGHDAVDWFQGNRVFVVLVLVMMWAIGGGIVINLAALQGVPVPLIEAAELDGAGPVRRFLHVTLPTISPILLFQLITATIGAMQAFLPALLLSPVTGPTAITAVPEANKLYMIEVYARYFALNQYGYASAMLWILFVAVLLLTALVFKVSGRAVFYAVEPDRA